MSRKPGRTHPACMLSPGRLVVVFLLLLFRQRGAKKRYHSRGATVPANPVRRIPCATSTQHAPRCASVHRCLALRCLHASSDPPPGPWRLALSAPHSVELVPGNWLATTRWSCASTLPHAHTRLGLGLGLGLGLVPLGHEAARLEHASDPAPPPCPCADTVSAQ